MFDDARVQVNTTACVLAGPIASTGITASSHNLKCINTPVVQRGPQPVSMTGTQTASDPVPAMRMGPLPQYDPDLAYGAASPRRLPRRRRRRPPTPTQASTPTPAPTAPGRVAMPRKPALLRVTTGRGFAEATVRLMRRSVITGRLLRGGTRVVGIRRVVARAGTRIVRVSLKRKVRRQLRRRGLERVTLTLRIAVVERSGAPYVFRYRVRVRV